MNLVTWGNTPWGEPVILHASWGLLWISVTAGAAFAAGHAMWARKRAEAAAQAQPGRAGAAPERILRHSLPARLFHWIMAAAVLTLMATAFLPKLGLHFEWLGPHVLAGVVLAGALAFHVVHALFFMDFKAIWPSPADLAELKGAPGGTGTNGACAKEPSPRAGKYPLGNKLYHLAAMGAVLVMAGTGLAMLIRVRTALLARDPYRFFGDGGWGMVYALHGLAGMALIALVIVHVYFALRPEKRPVTMSMLGGSLDRDYYLAHHDPARWDGRGGKP